jgi:hypothetical protein
LQHRSLPGHLFHRDAAAPSQNILFSVQQKVQERSLLLFPDNPGHFIAVHFNERRLHGNLGHRFPPRSAIWHKIRHPLYGTDVSGVNEAEMALRPESQPSQPSQEASPAPGAPAADQS